MKIGEATLNKGITLKNLKTMAKEITLREYEEIRAFLKTMEVIYKEFTPQIIHLLQSLNEVIIIEYKNR